MTTEHQSTREEEAHQRVLREVWDDLSKPAQTAIEVASQTGYSANMLRSYLFTVQDYQEAWERMHIASLEFTDRDRELLTKYAEATLKACISIDPTDLETVTGYGVFEAHLYHWYRMEYEMLSNILGLQIDNPVYEEYLVGQEYRVVPLHDLHDPEHLFDLFEEGGGLSS